MELGPEHRRRVARLAQALERARLRPGDTFDCPYLPGREARHVLLGAAQQLPPGIYHALMDLNFRRMGPVLYRPECPGCDACRMLRVPVDAQRPNRAQRRCRRRNADLTVAVAAPRPTAEKLALYRRYLGTRHDGRMDGSWEEFHDFLYTVPATACEATYSLGGKLLAVGLYDTDVQALSAVYCYFDPDESARSLGIFNVLWLLDECRRRGAPYLYLGYYVAGSRAMEYKKLFQPCEILGADGRWSAG